MTLKSLALWLGVFGLCAASGPVNAQELRSGVQEVRSGALIRTADAEGGPRGYRRKRPPLEIDIYAPRRRGGYSYRVQDITSTYNRRNPPPYAHVRQTPSGPFDSGFFFDSGFGPRAGDAPYPN
jgi:hypothetical protein